MEVSNHRRIDCLLNCLFRRSSKKISKLHVTGLCEWNSSVTGEFPSQRASNAENVSIWWRHHVVFNLNTFRIRDSLWGIFQSFINQTTQTFILKQVPHFMVWCGNPNYQTSWDVINPVLPFFMYLLGIMTSWHGGAFHVTGPLWGESIRHKTQVALINLLH